MVRSMGLATSSIYKSYNWRSRAVVAIKIRTAPRTFLEVDVARSDCPLRPCFWYREHFIRSAAGMSGCSSRASGQWVCGRRDQNGCPQPCPERMENPRYQKVRGDVWEEVEEE